MLFTKRLRNKKNINCVAFALCIFLIVFPFITYFHLEKLSVLQNEYIANTNGYTSDFFLYHKEVVLIIAALVVAIHTFINYVISKKDNRGIIFNPNNRVILLFGFAAIFFISASTVNAYIHNQSETVWLGITTEYEGNLALLAYIIMFFAGFNYIDGKCERRLFIKSILILSVIIGVLAIIEYCYKPIYEISFMKYLIAPSEYRDAAQSLKNTSFIGQSALAFYNPGYLGGACALLMPIVLGQIVTAHTKSKRIFALVALGLIFVALVASNSTAALYATVFCMVIELTAIFILNKKICKTQKPSAKISGKSVVNIIVCILVVICVLTVTDIFAHGKLRKTFKKTLFHEETIVEKSDIFRLDSITLEDGRIIAKSGEKNIVFVNDEKSGTLSEIIKVKGNDDKLLSTKSEGNKLSITADGYEAVSAELEDNIMYVDFGYEEKVPFFVTGNGFYLAGQNSAELEMIPQPKVQGYEKYYHIATGRGYTWIQSIPEIGKNILFGCGAGNFMYNFRQNEVAGLLNTHGSSQFVVDKPHNMYLEMAIEQGMLWTIIFVGMFALLVIKALRAIKHNSLENNVVMISFLLSVFAFLITGMVNDSIVTINPIFWIIYGVTWNYVQN